MKQFLYSIAAVMCTVSAQAGIVNYECELHSLEAQGWIPPVVLLSVDADNKRARAFDGAIRSANELARVDENTPANAKFKLTRKGEYRLSWRLTLSSNSTRQYRVSYTATVDPETNKLKMSASFPQANLGNRPSGIGRCQPISAPTLF
ncbi:hypothetical protein NBRC116589_05800 [Ruegeria sp. HU-ET01832]|uniref:hypothetical protein n=1 Tax=Ruegeria sp. HU-ET01832 TaxID=3135906 RepID=UPI0031045763